MLPDAARINSALQGCGLGDVPVEQGGPGLVVRAPSGKLRGVLESLKGCGFDFLVDLFAVDTGEAVDVVYLLRSFSRDEDLAVKHEVAYDGTLESVWEVYPAAVYPEREAAELFGMKLSGSPNPKRLLTVDGVEPLLRKSVEIRTPEQARDRAGDTVGLA